MTCLERLQNACIVSLIAFAVLYGIVMIIGEYIH